MKILPGKGIGAADLGASRDSLRAILGPYRSFRRGNNDVDDFTAAGIQVTYDSNSSAEYLEAYPPGSGELHGRDLFEMSLAEVKTFLENAGHNVATDDVGLDLRDIGLGVYAPDGSRIEAISVYGPGYYD